MKVISRLWESHSFDPKRSLKTPNKLMTYYWLKFAPCRHYKKMYIFQQKYQNNFLFLTLTSRVQYCSSCQWPAQSHETTWSLNCVVVIHWKNNNSWHVQEWQFSRLRVVTLHIHCNVPQKYSLESLRNFLTVFSTCSE